MSAPEASPPAANHPPDDPGFFARRRLLKLGLLGGGLLLGAGGGLLGLRGCAPAVEGLQVLSAHEYRTMASLASALLPQGGCIAAGAEDFGIARRFDAFLADEPAQNQSDLQAALALLEFGPLVLERRAATFSNLDPAERVRHWETYWVCGESLLRRQVSVALRKFIYLVYYDQETVWPALGYPGPATGVRPG